MKLSYKAWDAAGKSVVDVIDAPSVADARENLRRRGLFVERINESATGGGNGRPRMAHDHSSSGDDAAAPTGGWRRKRSHGKRLKSLSAFCRQMYIMIKTGTPIVQSLEAVERQTRDTVMKQAIREVRIRVEEGESLSEAMAIRPEYFDPASRSLIAAGESAGKLPMMLERIAALARRQVTLRSNVVGSMVYPTLLISVSTSVLIVMLTFVLPRFAELFDSLDAPLPATTVMLMDLSYLLRHYWWAYIGGGIVGLIGLIAWLRTPNGKAVRDTVLLRTPFLGKLIRNFATAKIARLMGILLDSYLPLLDVIALVKETSSNVHYRKLMENAEDAVIHGEPMSKAFADERTITPSVYEALRNGEESGQIAPLMLTVADFLDEENEVIVRSLTSILEPVILILLGLLVGFVALSMFLPLFDLTASAAGG